jgi:hypothetical protein
MTAMTEEMQSKFEEFLEQEKKYDLMDKFYDAMEAGDREKVKELAREIVILPETAMSMLRSMGKKRLLATGFNLSAANKAFGEGWIHEPPHPKKYH